MKYNKRIVCMILLCLCLMLSGCGKLYVMTEEEENQVVLYAAKMVSKYNRAQDTGYSYVSADTRTEAEPKAPEDVTDEETPEEPRTTLTEVLGLEGVTATYQGYDIASSYTTMDVAIPDAEEGYAYLILHIQLANVTEQDIVVDLINHPITYGVTVNEGGLIEGITTLSMSDLSTYYNKSLAANTIQDTVLLFQVGIEETEDIQQLVLQVTKDGQTNNVNLTDIT